MWTLRKYYHLPLLQASVIKEHGVCVPKGKTDSYYDNWGSSLRSLALSMPSLRGDWLSLAKPSRHHVTLCQSLAGEMTLTFHLQLRPAVSSAYLLPLYFVNSDQLCKIQIKHVPRTPENQTPKPNQSTKQTNKNKRGEGGGGDGRKLISVNISRNLQSESTEKLGSFCKHTQLALLVAFPYGFGVLSALGTLKTWKLKLLGTPWPFSTYAPSHPLLTSLTFARTCVSLPEGLSAIDWIDAPGPSYPSHGITPAPRASQSYCICD